MGDSRDWKPRSYVILGALAAMNAIRLIPTNPHSNLDIIPMDYAVRAIAGLLFAKRRWTTYHISAGKASATNLDKMLVALAGTIVGSLINSAVPSMSTPRVGPFSSAVSIRTDIFGFFRAYSLTASGARRSELPSRSTGLTALPRHLE